MTLTLVSSERTGLLSVPNAAPLTLARHFLEHRGRDEERRLLIRRWNEEWWRYQDGRYRSISNEVLAASMYPLLEITRVPKRRKDGSVEVVEVSATCHRVRELREALPSCGTLFEGDAPCWLDGDGDRPASEIVACKNGLLHVTQDTLHAANPAFFTTNALTFDYDANASEPTEWLAFLDSLWHDAPDQIAALQEMFGYLLLPDTSQQKMFFLKGPPRSGKGTIATVLQALVGDDNYCSPTLSSLKERFGLQSMLGKSLAIIPDARLQTHAADKATIVERLLAISGEDKIDVDRKNRCPVTVRLHVRFMLMSNELPHLPDAATALASRFILLEMNRSFRGKEDRGLKKRLLSELPGILNWAIAGWKRLDLRGHFVQPASSAESWQEFEHIVSPVTCFVQEKCIVGGEHEATRCEVWNEWKAWCDEEGCRPGTRSQFFRRLHAAVPGLGNVRPRQGDDRPRMVVGLKLRPRWETV